VETSKNAENHLGKSPHACIKIIDSDNNYYFQRKEYVKYAKVFPLSELLDFKMPPKWYRRIVGSVEIICGLAMALVPTSKYNITHTFRTYNRGCIMVYSVRGAEWIVRISWLARAPLGPIFMTGLPEQ